MAISSSYNILVMQVTMGINAGASSTIGNVIGEGNEPLAKMIGALAYIEGTVIGLVLAFLTYSCSEQIASTYTSNGDSIKLLSTVLEAASLVIAGLA